MEKDSFIGSWHTQMALRILIMGIWGLLHSQYNIPEFNVNISYTDWQNVNIFCRDYCNNFGLHWIEQFQPLKTVICSDSVAALWGFSSIQTTVMVETHIMHFTLQKENIFSWLTTDTGVRGSEQAGKLTKKALKHVNRLGMQVCVVTYKLCNNNSSR